MKYVLFVCTHNAGRSQMAQSFFERDCSHDCRAESAGSQPARKVWPEVIDVMREVVLGLAGHKPKRLTVEMPLAEVREIRDVIQKRVRDLVENRIEEIESDPTSHQWRLAKLLPPLIQEFGDRLTPGVIRGCADRILDDYDHVPIRSHIFSLAHKRTRECLKQDTCVVLPHGDGGAATPTAPPG